MLDELYRARPLWVRFRERFWPYKLEDWRKGLEPRPPRQYRRW